MKKNSPSKTAALVALGRAMADIGLSHVPDFRDPTARVFLSDKGKDSLTQLAVAVKNGTQGKRIDMARGMANMMALRTSAIDNAVSRAVNGGAKQLVILGAGYDGRAWRMPALEGVRVFEVDHPSTQNDKRARVGELATPIGEVTFVPIDFERESIMEVLERAGHDRAQRTCWIWEGVVMYLTREAMRATLAAIAARSADGSTLIVNYHSGRRSLFARLMFRLLGESQISAWTSSEMTADLSHAGFRVNSDSNMPDWSKQFAEGRAEVERASYMRIAVATRNE